MTVEQMAEVYQATAAAARAVGAGRYFTGKPCPKGHVALRKTANTTCTACIKGSEREIRIEWKRRDRLKRRGGCTPEIKADLIASQNGQCAICSTTAELFVDHCHATNKIRAALCRSCNLALGMAKDRPDILREMATYLEAHMTNPRSRNG
ncbi:MAG: endonuclease domain-containing protein [Sphingomonas sp.]